MRAMTLALAASLAIFMAPAGLALPGAARAASFDCAKASAPTDVAICSNPTLSAMDSQLGLAYAQRLATNPAWRQVERGWLVARNDGCGHSVGCLSTFTALWTRTLQGGAMPPNLMPLNPGACALTAVKQVETRLDGMPGSGSAVEETNTGYQVSYDTLAAVDNSRRGDPLLMCLVSLPSHCPAGDDRGKVYAVANLRTLKGWSLPDSQHDCGGA